MSSTNLENEESKVLVDSKVLTRFWNNTKEQLDTKVQSVKIGTTEYKNGTDVVLPAYPSTPSEVGLSNVENKSSEMIRNEITSSNITNGLGYTPLNSNLKGTASGLAELDEYGKVLSSQLPSFVDDVVEGYLYNGKFYKESAHTNVITGESGKIYTDLGANKTYRWSGSAFVVISETIALGETSSTAYRGDRGKTAYDHASNKGSAFASGFYKITTNSEGHVTGATAVTKEDITGLGISDNDHVHDYLPLSGGTITGALRVNSIIWGYNYANNNNAPAFVFDKKGTNITGIGSNGENDTIFLCAVNSSDFSWNTSYKQKWKFNGEIIADNVRINNGSASMVYNASTESIDFVFS